MEREGFERPRACGTCGLVQRVPHLAAGTRARCSRCGSVVARPERAGAAARDLGWTAGLALAALVVYPVAVGLPFMTVERLGHSHASSVLAAGLELLRHGQWLVGAVVFLCSIVLPLFKLTGLLLVSTSRGWMRREHRALTWHVIEWTGRWGMIDVLLAAILVAMLKLGDLVSVEPGPGLVAFTALVVLSLLAGAVFDPHSLWERE